MPPWRWKLPPKKSAPKPAPRATRKKVVSETFPAAQAEATEDRIDPVEPNAVLLRIVTAAVTSRIRHRALLDVLGSGPYDYGRYVERFKEIRERDYQALFAQYMLKKNDFSRIFGDWFAEDMERYRVDRGDEPKPTRKQKTRKSS